MPLSNPVQILKGEGCEIMGAGVVGGGEFWGLGCVANSTDTAKRYFIIVSKKKKNPLPCSNCRYTSDVISCFEALDFHDGGEDFMDDRPIFTETQCFLVKNGLCR